MGAQQPGTPQSPTSKNSGSPVPGHCWTGMEMGPVGGGKVTLWPGVTVFVPSGWPQAPSTDQSQGPQDPDTVPGPVLGMLDAQTLIWALGCWGAVQDPASRAGSALSSKCCPLFCPLAAGGGPREAQWWSQATTGCPSQACLRPRGVGRAFAVRESPSRDVCPVCASCASHVGGVGLGLMGASTPGCTLSPGAHSELGVPGTPVSLQCCPGAWPSVCLRDLISLSLCSPPHPTVPVCHAHHLFPPLFIISFLLSSSSLPSSLLLHLLPPLFVVISFLLHLLPPLFVYSVPCLCLFLSPSH